MENAGYIFAAFAIVWIAILAYLMVLSNRQRRLEREIESLKGTFEESGANE
jgi:CcmD family protein